MIFDLLYCTSVHFYSIFRLFLFVYCPAVVLTNTGYKLIQVPESLLTGLKHQRLSNARASAKTQDKIAGRLDLIASEGMDFGPYADDVMDAELAPLSERVRAIISLNLVS